MIIIDNFFSNYRYFIIDVFPKISDSLKLLKLVHGTTDVVKQITSKHLLKMNIKCILPESNNSTIEKIQNVKILPNQICKNAPKAKLTSNLEEQLKNCTFYEKITIQSTTYSTSNYKKSRKN